MTDQSGYPGAPPGWYPDPAGGPGQRWWDGYAWTESTVLPQQPPPPPWATASPPQGPPTTIAPWAEASQRLSTFNTASLVDNELRLASLARFAIVLPAVYWLFTLIENRVNARRSSTSGTSSESISTMPRWERRRRLTTVSPRATAPSSFSSLS